MTSLIFAIVLRLLPALAADVDTCNCDVYGSTCVDATEGRYRCCVDVGGEQVACCWDSAGEPRFDYADCSCDHSECW